MDLSKIALESYMDILRRSRRFCPQVPLGWSTHGNVVTYKKRRALFDRSFSTLFVSLLCADSHWLTFYSLLQGNITDSSSGSIAVYQQLRLSRLSSVCARMLQMAG